MPRSRLGQDRSSAPFDYNAVRVHGSGTMARITALGGIDMPLPDRSDQEKPCRRLVSQLIAPRPKSDHGLSSLVRPYVV